jgi:uncharacterized protein (DUF924 family)
VRDRGACPRLRRGEPLPAPGLPLDVLEFWFGTGRERGKPRPQWFRKDEAFDALIRSRFGETHAAARAGQLEDWRETREGRLARVIVLDQFSRNLFRNDARAFAQDAQALDSAREAIERGDERELLPVERHFLYMPFEHSEALVDQQRSLELFGGLEAFPETRDLIEWARRHHAIVERFGRFPHRNAALGRACTEEETAFLAQPGSGF